MDRSLKGKVALVTGAGLGIGRSTALAFARDGADVVLAARRSAPLEMLAQEIAEESGRRVFAVPTDITDLDACAAVVARTVAEFGRLDVLVNVATASFPRSKIMDIDWSTYADSVQLNVIGTMKLCADAAQKMSETGGGSIINISSVAAVMPTAIDLPYAIAKAGLNNLTMGLARALAPKVRVNCIMPGPFLTEISKAWPKEAFDHFEHSIPLRRAGNPDEIVGAALYLASDLSSYTTGAVIKIDGGSTHAPA